MTTRCPDRCLDLAALERVFPEAGDDLRAHLATCTRCGAAWNGWSELAALGRELPPDAVGEARRRALRDAIVARAGHAAPVAGRRRGRTVAAGAIAVAAAVAIAWTARRHEPPPVAPRASPADVAREAVVHAHDGAAWWRVGAPPDEIVRLTRGTVTVEVEPLRPGHRFRVVTGDAEVEVRGTVFEVTARDDRLVSVYVLHGRVEVRRAGDPPYAIDATQRWTAPQPAATPEQHPALAPVPVPAQRPRAARDDAAPAPGPAPAERPRARPDELRYQEAWSALRSGDLGLAAAAFEEVAADEGALATEAIYWRAVALGRARRSAEAATALEDYLGRPAPPRADEAAAMLGWILFERGDREGAASLFRRAAGSGSQAARDSGRRGLEALAR